MPVIHFRAGKSCDTTMARGSPAQPLPWQQTRVTRWARGGEHIEVAISKPSETTRWRCAQCGNLTRFDVVRSSQVREYVHVDLAGVQKVEESDVLSESLDEVTCRWCGGKGTVEVVARPDSA